MSVADLRLERVRLEWERWVRDPRECGVHLTASEREWIITRTDWTDVPPSLLRREWNVSARLFIAHAERSGARGPGLVRLMRRAMMRVVDSVERAS